MRVRLVTVEVGLRIFKKASGEGRLKGLSLSRCMFGVRGCYHHQHQLRVVRGEGWRWRMNMRNDRGPAVSEKGGGGKGRGVYIRPIFLFKPFDPRPKSKCRSPTRPSSSSSSSSSRREQFSFAFPRLLPGPCPLLSSRAPRWSGWGGAVRRGSR